jgi:hypothetical protein
MKSLIFINIKTSHRIKFPPATIIKYLILAVALFSGVGFAYTAYADGGFTISGTLTFGSTPLTSSNGAYVDYKASDGSGGVVDTDANGNYSLSGVPNDNYGVTVFEEGNGKTVPTEINNMKSTNYPLTVGGSDVTQNLSLNAANVIVTVKDASGVVEPGAEVLLGSVAGSTIYDSSGTFSFSPGNNMISDDVTTGSDGTVTAAVIPGVTYTLCAYIGSTEHCASNITVSSDTSAEVDFPSPIPNAPTNLTIPSPTAAPSLTWDSVSGATSYNIYRDGTLLDSSTTNSYTDNSATVGSHTYYVTAVNSSGESSLSNSITVVVGTVPAFTSPSTATTGQGAPFSFTVTTTGSPAPALSYTGNLPAGTTFTDNGDGTATISGTITGTVGTYLALISANNGIGGTVNQDFILTVNPVNITSATSSTATYGSPYSFTVTATGSPTPTLTKTDALPAGVTFTDNGDGTATIAGTPTGSASGIYTLTIKAKNNQQTVTQIFVLTVNRAPTINNITNKTTSVGTAFSMTVNTNGYTTPALTESGTLPNGLTFTDNGDGTATIAGTPATGSGGSYSITVTATNQLGTTSQTFTLKVKEAPTITSPATANATVGSAFSFQVTDTGYPAPSITKTGTLPRGISFQASTGTFSGTPAAGTAGSYPITITVTNSSGTVTQNFVLVVS